MTMKSFVFIVLMTLFCTTSKAALADQITVRNNTQNIMYKIFAWPTELIPRTYNIITSPLIQGESRDVVIDNSYQYCEFTLQYDPNNPRDLKRRGYKKKPIGYIVADICLNKNIVTIKK